MIFRFVLLLLTLSRAMFAGEDTIELDPIRASLSYIYFRIKTEPDTDKISEIRVVWVAPGSGAEKSGLREGDLLLTINGISVAGKQRSEVTNRSGGIRVRGTDVAFSGRRGFLRRNWSIAARIDVQGNMTLLDAAQPPSGRPR